MAGIILVSAGSTSLVANATTRGTERYKNNTITVTSQAKSTGAYGYVSYPVKTGMQLTSTIYISENTKANGHSTSMNNTTGVGVSFSLAQKYRNQGRKVFKVRTTAKVLGHTFYNSATGKYYVEDYR